MKRYALFMGDYAWPLGGWSDLAGTYDTVGEAREAFIDSFADWAHVVDLTTRSVVWTTNGEE